MRRPVGLVVGPARLASLAPDLVLGLNELLGVSLAFSADEDAASASARATSPQPLTDHTGDG